MLETLAATATTFAQALHSLTWVEKIPGIQYWAGSNATEFNVTALQKPKDFKIPHQLELEMVRCVPAVTSITRPSADLLLVAVLEEHRALLSSNHQAIVAELERAHPLLNGLHSVAAATVQDRADGTPLALVLLQTALPELTVANVYSWVWVFPFDKGIEWIDLCRRLRSLEILSTVPLQIAVQLGSALHRNSDEKLTPSCWRFTHKRELPLLRKSFQETFGSLLIKYSEQEVQAFAAMLGQ